MLAYHIKYCIKYLCMSLCKCRSIYIYRSRIPGSKDACIYFLLVTNSKGDNVLVGGGEAGWGSNNRHCYGYMGRIGKSFSQLMGRRDQEEEDRLLQPGREADRLIP